MPLTDEDFAPASLDATLTALRNRGYDPLDQAAKDKFTADTETRLAGTITKELLGSVDTAALEAGEVPKLANEKTSDYVKRVVAHYKSDATGRAARITELEKAIADGTADGTMKAQLEALQQSDTAKTEKLTAAEKRIFELGVENDVRIALLGVKLNPALPASVQQVMLERATAAVVGMAATEKGADGTTRTVYIDPVTKKVALGAGNQPATATELVQKQLIDVLDTGVSGTGTGATGGGTGTTGADGQPVAPQTLPTDIKNRGQLGDHLKKLGFTVGSKTYDKEMERLGKGLPAR